MSATIQGLGRSRGGLTTKVIVTATDESTTVAIDVTLGQTSNFNVAEGVTNQTWVDEVVGDNEYDRDAIRSYLIDPDVYPVIPNKQNSFKPERFDEGAYRDRNKIERLFAKAKQFRWR